MILLDTNICVRILRGEREALAFYKRLRGNLAIPFMVVGELYYGAEHSKNPERGRLGVEKFLEPLPIYDTTQAIMCKFGECKAKLAAKGQIVEDADILIAATALTFSCPLATENVRHFERFEDLEIQDWKAQDFKEEETR